jgi:hypothetical protein
MTARAGDAMRVTRASRAIDDDIDRATRANARFAWLTLVFAAWLLGAVVAAVRAAIQGIGEAGFQRAVDSFSLGLFVLSVVCLLIVVPAVRKGRPWRTAFPPGYGVVGAGLVVLLAWEVADRGWVLGVAELEGIEGLLSPTRILLVIGLVLVACGPLHAASRSAGTGATRWAAVVSAAFVLTAVLLPGSFSPASSSWLERPTYFPGGELWLMDGDGSHQTRLITKEGRIGLSTPAWSPDGSRIAFVRVRFGDHSPVDDEAEVWVADADGSHSHALVQGPGYKWLPHWSPDGVWLVYTDEPPGGPWMAVGPRGIEGAGGQVGLGFLSGQASPVREHAEIWRVRADGTDVPEQITRIGSDDRAATYSPDGTKLAFDSTRDGNTRIWIMNVDGSDWHRVSYGDDDWGATWSPDGRWIAYRSWMGSLEPDPQIWVMAPDGSSRRRLTSGPGDHWAPSWSADGSRVAFALQAPDKPPAIWSVALDGSDLRNLTNDPSGSAELTSGGGAWSKDGRIAYARGEPPPVIADQLVSEDLAVAAILVTAMLVALVCVLAARIDPPFGAFAAILGISTIAFAATSEEWRFVPAAFVGGLTVDLLVRTAPERWKAVAAGAGSAGALVVGAALTVTLTSSRLGWSPTLLAGVIVASVVLGTILAEVIGPTRSEPSVQAA